MTSTVIFVCEHGAAKSIVAAAYFNKLASAMGLNFKGVARGTTPDLELSQKAVNGLLKDGLIATESKPQKLEFDDLQNAKLIVTFCELPVEYSQELDIKYWHDVPPISENYELARDIIIKHIDQLLTDINKI